MNLRAQGSTKEEMPLPTLGSRVSAAPAGLGLWVKSGDPQEHGWGPEARIGQEQVFHALGYKGSPCTPGTIRIGIVLCISLFSYISAPKGFGHGAAAEMPKGKWGLGDDLPQCSSTQPGLCLL